MLATREICGTAVVDAFTKRAIRRILPGHIAVLQHEDIDRLAASDLIEAGVQAIVNFKPTVSGKYRAQGPLLLLEHGIPVLDIADSEKLDCLRDGMRLWLQGEFLGTVTSQGKWLALASGRRLTFGRYRQKIAEAEQRSRNALSQFFENTLEHMWWEKDQVLRERLNLPSLQTPVSGRLAVIVVRGNNYREDLQALYHHLLQQSPVFIGVDGGADALLELGIVPDIILGDMDSVSDEGLHCGAELVVHAYPNGHSPGLQRIHQHRLRAAAFASLGTSEDAALLLMHGLGASQMVLIGSHSHPEEFWEKGRQGMGSTLLVRMLLGSSIIDVKGLHAILHHNASTLPVFLPARRGFSHEKFL